MPDDARLLMAGIAREFTGRGTARALLLRGLASTLLGLAARHAPSVADDGQQFDRIAAVRTISVAA